MTRILLAFLATFTLSTTAFTQFQDPNAQVREVKSFHAIRVSHAFDVYLSQGNEEAVAVSSSDKGFLEKIVVYVREGVLYIGLEKGFRINFGNKNLKAYISFKNIDALDIRGACNVKIEGTLKADELNLDISGASDLEGKVEINTLSASLSGSADANIHGTANTLDLDASGASTFNAFKLVTDLSDVHVSGASNVRVTVNKELKAHATGASDVDYRGAGVIKKIHTSGSSSVSKVES
jgi:hypothetical protein